MTSTLIERVKSLESNHQVAAFLDHLEENDTPLLGRHVIPEEYLYRIAMVNFLLRVAEIARERGLEVEVSVERFVDDSGRVLESRDPVLVVMFQTRPWSETAVLLPSQMAAYGDKWNEGLQVVLDCADRLPRVPR